MGIETLEQKSAKDLAGLQIDLLHRLRNGNLSFEQIEWFKNLPFEQREKLMGKLVKIEHPKMKLISQNIVVTGLVGKFNPKQHFTENEKVKYWLSDNFQKHVLKLAKCLSNFPEESFSKHQFTETIYDKEIMELFQISESNGLVTCEEILWTIASLTSKQPKGEAGALLNNGYSTIIGYMLCDDGVVRAVNVCWLSGNAGWYCDCRDLHSWYASHGMLSRS